MYMICDHAEDSVDVSVQFQHVGGSAEVHMHASLHSSSKRTFLLSAGDTDRFCQLDSQNISASLIYSSPFGVSLKNIFLQLKTSEPWSYWQDTNTFTQI